MSKPFVPKAGTTAECAAFTGLENEVVLDEEKGSLIVHDGVTAGGAHEILPKDQNDERYAPKNVDVGVTKVNGKTGDVTVLGVDEEQSLTEAQQEQALTNLGVFAALETLITEAGGTIPS